MVERRTVSRPQLVSPPLTQGPVATGLSVTDTSQFVPEIGGSVDSVRREIDDAFADMKTFHNRQPDEIMRMAMGHSARLSELRVLAQRVEDYHRVWKLVRTREIEPALTECERQYQLGSRLHSVRELDWKMEQGER